MKCLVANGLLALLLGIVGMSEAIAQTTTGSGVTGARGGASNRFDYSPGTRIRSNGVIQNSRGETMVPRATVPHGDGSTTFYYPNGTSVRVNESTISPTGAPLREGSRNGGLSNDTRSPNRVLLTP